MGPPNQQLGDGLCEGFWRCLYPPEFKCVNLLILTVIKGCILTIEWACFHSIVHVNFLLQVVRIRIKMNKKWVVAVAKTLNKSDFVPFVFCL